MRTVAVAVSCAALAVVGLALSGWPASTYVHGDFIQYWLASRALLEGWDPYDPVVWRAMHEAVVGNDDFFVVPGAGFSYPLTTAVAALPFALLGVAQSAPLWFVAQTGSAIAGLTTLQRRMGGPSTGRRVGLLLGLGAVMQPVFLLAGQGNIVRFLPGILSFALVLLLSGRPFAAGVLLGLLVLKPQLFIVFALAILLIAPSSRIRLVGGSAATVATLLTISLALRPSWIGPWVVQSIHVEGQYGTLNLWGGLGHGWVAWVVAAAAIVALLAWWRVRHPPLMTAAATALALSLYLAPYAADYDQAVLLVCLAAYLAAIAGLSVRIQALLVVLFIGTSSALSWPAWIGIVQPGWQTALPAPAACLLLVVADFVVRRTPQAG